MRQVYLQLLDDGSWVTATDARGARIVAPLTHETLRQLRAMPHNARLVYVDTGKVAVSRHTIDQFRFDAPEPASPRKQPRPLVRRTIGVPARVGKLDRSNHLGSWYAAIVMR